MNRYDIGILSTVFVAPGYQEALDHPTPGQTGLIAAIFSVGMMRRQSYAKYGEVSVNRLTVHSAGGWFSYGLLAGPLNDHMGRRWAGVAGVVVLCVGAALQAGAIHLSMMIIGRLIAGVGTSIVATAVPLYLSEISPARHRGAILALNQIGIVS